MNTVDAALRAVADDLTQMAVPFALAGGLAVSVRAEPRFTRDVDLALAVDSDTAAEEVIRALLTRGYTVVALVEQQYVERLGTARMTGPAAPSVPIDLLFATCGIEPEIAAAAELLDIEPGWALPVARVGHLVAMKLLAQDEIRPQDAADLIALAAVLDTADKDEARDAARLIDRRGFGRGKDLPTLVEEYLKD